jgi:ATP/maltotriose-dependent transcriptional regulator MalT
LRYTTERDLDSVRGYMEAWRSLSLLYRGRWREAGALASTVMSRTHSSAITRMMVLLAAGRLRARRGDPDVQAALDEALEMADRTTTLQRIGPIRAARAEAAWLAGDSATMEEEARAAIELARAKGHPWHLGELAWWLSRAGVQPGPDDIAKAAEPWRLQLQGRWREAAGAWLAHECPFEAARALLDSDRPADVQEALAGFDRLGARPAAAMAAARLRALGVRAIPRGPRASTRANPAGLTARELEVLRLVAAGLANHEIAAKLFLSIRTVDHHVAAVLGKLQVDRRAAAGPAAERLGIELQNGQPADPI